MSILFTVNNSINQNSLNMSDYIMYPILVFIVFTFKTLGIGLAIIILLYVFASKSVKEKCLNVKGINSKVNKMKKKFEDIKEKEEETEETEEYEEELVEERDE